MKRKKLSQKTFLILLGIMFIFFNKSFLYANAEGYFNKNSTAGIKIANMQ
ncbi:MAG: hypothetical protein U9532_04065 ['Conium maculatum' witches'-broom phytoplasma]|nr:hypothetical protein ['Conium maculatum' witches'-broom phytoplasma]